MDSDSSLPSKLEISKLRCILDSLEDEIKLSYTQTRPKFNDEVEAQLRHALSEVSHREKDLIAIVGISKHLIQSYQDLEEKFLKLQEKSETLSQNLESLNSENFKLKEENQLMEDKYLETLDDKNKLDEEVHRLESRLQVMKREMSKKSVKLSLDISNYMSASDEIFDLSSHYKEELEAGRNYKKDSESKIQDLENKIKELRKTVKEQEKIIEQMKEEKDVFSHSSHVQSTDADSFVSSNRPRPCLIKTSFTRFGSEDTENNLESYKESLESETLINTSLCTPIKTFDIVPGDKIMIYAKSDHFQEFTEEIFFNMTLNAIKINLPQYSSLGVDAKDLFRLAVKSGIPLHKWNMWIESQLNLLLIKNNSKCSIIPRGKR